MLVSYFEIHASDEMTALHEKLIFTDINLYFVTPLRPIWSSGRREFTITKAAPIRIDVPDVYALWLQLHYTDIAWSHTFVVNGVYAIPLEVVPYPTIEVKNYSLPVLPITKGGVEPLRKTPLTALPVPH